MPCKCELRTGEVLPLGVPGERSPWGERSGGPRGEEASGKLGTSEEGPSV